MYVEFLRGLVAWVEALNGAGKMLKQEDEMLSPYVNFVPVILGDVLCGFLVDEIGGTYSYREASQSEHAWWAGRPKQSDDRGAR